MSSTECPLCNKRYPEIFIAAHASSCNPTTRTKRTRPKNTFCVPLYRISTSASSPPSETGAPGFHIFPQIFSDIESKLLHFVQCTPPQWSDYRFRKVKNYGPPYNLRKRSFLFGPSAPPQIPFPQFVNDLIIPRLRTLPLLERFKPNQLSVAEYLAPGGHILPHNDCENGEIGTAVVGVCLASRCTMTLILRARYSGLGKDVKKDIVLQPGAVYVMSGDALRVWEHAIFACNIKATRYSLTFRDVSPSPSSPSQVVPPAMTGDTHETLLSSRPEKPALDIAGDLTASKIRAPDKQSTAKRRRLIQQRFT